MNYVIFLGIVNLILLSRLRLILRDNGINRSDLWTMTSIPLIGLLFLRINTGWYLLAFYLISYPALMWFLERRKAKLNRNRILTLGIHFIAIGFLCSPALDLSSNVMTNQVVNEISELLAVNAPSSSLSVTVQLFLFGFLMILNEANIVLRYLLELLGLRSLGKSSEVDRQEYNTGRIIGLLERIFVFLFVILNQYTAIGFILAAKGVTRFKDFESRTFAEYVLVGTLLSALLAVVMAFVVKINLYL